MKRMLENKRTLVAAVALLGSIVPAQAGLLNIATDPLGTATTSNKPNVMFILDDSGSMGRDAMPDYIDDTHNPTAGTPTTAACADTGDDGSGSIGNDPDPCVFGDPPYNSPDLNGIYYNPAIFYRPAAFSDGTDMDSQNSVNTAGFTQVMVNPYTSTATADLSSGYQDRVFCIAQGDAATSGNCRQNSAYQYPDPTFRFGRDGSNNPKYVTGAPYYYRMQSAQYCTLNVATGEATTTCASGSSINVATHTVLAPEFCADPELTNCVAGANVDPTVHVFSGVRWCADAGTLVDCRRKKGDLVNLAGTVVKRYIYAKHLGVTQSITCPVGTYCSASPNEGNIRITSVNAAGGSISNITVNGVQVITGAITVPAGATTSTVAGLITTAINAKISSPEYTAVQSGSNVVITKTVTGSTGAGWAVVLQSSQIGTGSSIGRISVNQNSSPNSSQTITAITVNGVNLLCGTSSDITFGSVTVRASDGRIVANNGTNTATKRTDLRNAIKARVDACAVNGFRATLASNGVDVNLIAPVAQGASPNGLTVARTGSNLGNITTGNMGSVQNGTQVSAVNATIANMSGGRDALTGAHTIRKGVGAFTRTDIVPSNDSYPKAAGRLDCAAATCTYEEEMTNFANWYAYYRTRMQMMKAAVGRAFVSVGSTYRVGFITICPVSGNNCGTSSTGASVVSSKYLKIDDFTGTHRDNWYAKLYATQPSNFTPLREALSRVGLIFAGKFGTPLTGGLSVAAGDDPVTALCQPNFAILSTDGYWNGGAGKLLDGNTNVGNQDNVNTGPFSLQSQGVYDGALAGATNTLADVALFYYKTDLRGNADDDSVPTTAKDTASHQHMVTFTVGLGLDGQLTYRPDYETASSGDFFDIKQGTKKWPVPVADSPTALDDLWHAAVNGRGVFFSAKNPEELANGLAETLDQLQARVGAGAAAATSNLQPVAGDNFAFTAQYQTSSWIGDVKARTIDLGTGIVSQTVLWAAASIIDGTNYAARTLYTLDSGDSTGNLLKHFCWRGEGGSNCLDGAGLDGTEETYFRPNLLPQWTSFTTLQKDAATQSSGPSWTGPDEGRTLVNWLRGSGVHNDTGQSLPNDLYRERLSRLGDVVNAQPAYVKKSPFSYNDAGYSDFKKCTEGTTTVACPSGQFAPPTTSSRPGTVYAASNDGMLHAFNTDTGVERWAYIPRVVMPGLYRLAASSTPFPHAYHVDGSPLVADICVSPCSSVNDWRTILVAGLNSGGRGYYALDITNPLAPKALWEFTNSTFCVTTDDPGATADDITVPDFTTPVGGDLKSDCHVGLSYGNPIIAKRNEDGKWVVFVTSGYNNNVNGGDGQGYLYMLDAATGVILRRFTTGVGTAASPSGLAKINGWATSASLDNTVLAIYGGDLDGNLWRFDMDRASSSYLQVTKIAALVNGAGQAQPITVKPELGEVEVSGFKKRVVMLGTGKFLEATDKAGPFITQTIYALRDDLSPGAGPLIPDVRNTTLVKARQFTAGTTPDTRTVNPLDPAPNWSTEYGWRIDLPDTGEHVNIDPQLQLGTLVIASNVPTTDTCRAGGYAYINFLDYATGSYVPGAPGNMASTKIASSVAVGINVIMLPGGKVVAIVTTADNQQLTKDTPTPPAGFGGKRVSWRELIRDQ